MEKTIKRIFDFQRFEGNERLNNICVSVEEKYRQMEELSDDELYMVAAGRKNKPANPNSEWTCPKCKKVFRLNTAAWLSHKNDCNADSN